MKLCPFCGGKGVEDEESGFFLAVYVRCEECGASGSYCDTHEEAIEAWNQRSTDLPDACVYALNATEEAVAGLGRDE